MERGKRQAWSSFFGGAGFYIALLLCVVAVGVAGYFALFRDNTAEEVSSNAENVTQPTGNDAEEPVLPAEQEGSQGSSTPVSPPPQESVETSAPAAVAPPEVTEETEAITPEQPSVVVAPLAGETVATFSVEELQFNETLGDWRTHDGIDISAAAGTPVVAASAGTVTAVETGGSMGTTVVISHDDGYETTYASLQEEVRVEVGDTVSSGQEIGAVGNTTLTESALGAHLHFAVSKDGEAVDPAEYLP